ncbi:MAG: DUF4190 domain-containing protein [Phycisphaerales bacterium]|nr:DUF4190 domain-containing protein [Phycisphaerales bacterium]
MSQNPYATYGEPDLGTQARTSVLAILSLVCSLICCIPGLGALAAVLGGVALIRISGSNGRRSGVGLAIAGIIIGLVVTVIWGAVAVGAVTVLDKAGRLFTPIIQTVASDDASRMRAAVSPALAAAATDDDWKRFRAAISSELGDVNPTGTNAVQLIKQYSEVGRLMQGKQGSTNAFPIPLIGDKGKGILMVHLPRNTHVSTPGPNGPGSPAGEVLAMAINFSVLLPSGKEEYLVPPDRAPLAPQNNPAPKQLPPAPEKPPADGV